MLRAIVLVMLLVPGGIGQTEGHKATQKDWAEFFEAVGEFQATAAKAQTATLDKDTEWRFDECRFQSLDHGVWTQREELLTARCAASKAGIPLSTLTSIVTCESGFNRLAWNPAGPYVGLAQHALSSYVSRIRTYEPVAWDKPLSTDWRNSRGQLVMTARMMRDQGLGPWGCA